MSKKTLQRLLERDLSRIKTALTRENMHEALVIEGNFICYIELVTDMIDAGEITLEQFHELYSTIKEARDTAEKYIDKKLQ